MKVTDEQLLDAVTKIRAEYGACTYRALAAEVGVTAPTVWERCVKLRDQGRLTWSSLAGSLRLVDR